MRLTPEQAAAAAKRRLDVFCTACQRGSAITARCYICGSADLLIATHAEQQSGRTLWCQGGREQGATT